MIEGFHTMAADAYHADPCATPSLSNGIAQVLLTKSPYHAWLAHPRLNKDHEPENRKEFDLGTGAHDLLLEGGTTKICVIQPEDYRSKPTKDDPDGNVPKGWTNNAIRAARAEAYKNGLTPLLPWDHANIKRMNKVARDWLADSELAGILDAGKPEQTIIWQERGIWLRARLDWLPDDPKLPVLDYKTCPDAAPDVFNRRLSPMGYDFQAAFYQRGLRALGQERQFAFLAQEIEPPHDCSLHACDEALREICDAEVERAIGIWRDCLTRNEWPSYSKRIHWAVPAAWQMREHELRLQEAA